MRRLYLAGSVFVLLSLYLIARGPVDSGVGISVSHPPAQVGGIPVNEAGAWWSRMRPFCNPVEVVTRHRFDPAPDGLQGAGYSAACYGLAGKIDEAREVLHGLPPDDRWRAAGIVFNVAHPVADAGDEIAAGPVMRLVVEFWPNHYMALYHAGASDYSEGRYESARSYLASFLEHYAVEDGWTRSAREILSELEGR